MRTKLPNRREHETDILEWGPPGNGTCEVFVSAGYDAFGRLRETFIRGGGRVGSDRDFLLDASRVFIPSRARGAVLAGVGPACCALARPRRICGL
jgi:hypothetical protein